MVTVSDDQVFRCHVMFRIYEDHSGEILECVLPYR